MIPSLGYAAHDARSPLVPFSFERRELKPNDILIEILYCGICHSDVHQVRSEWSPAIYPIVPGHEIVGKVTRVGDNVKHFKAGDLAGVGCLVNSCRHCASCETHLEQYCENGFVATYNTIEKGENNPTYGGYANNIVVDQDFVLKISPKLELSQVAPLLCAGITTYSPLKHWKIGPGHKVGIMGLGGLGHMAVKLARSMGAHVVVFTTSTSKKEDALRLGAHEVVLSKIESEMKPYLKSFDFLLNAISAKINLSTYMQLLKRDGTMVMVGLPSTPPPVPAFDLILNRRTLAGSLIGGIKETQEMLDYCAKHNITSDVEIIPIQKVNEAYERMLKGDVKYRFVIDMKSL